MCTSFNNNQLEIVDKSGRYITELIECCDLLFRTEICLSFQHTYTLYFCVLEENARLILRETIARTYVKYVCSVYNLSF